MGSAVKNSHIAFPCLLRAHTFPIADQSEPNLNEKLEVQSYASVSFRCDRSWERTVKLVQVQSFSAQLARLKPFQGEGMLRVGGRLKHSELQPSSQWYYPESSQSVSWFEWAHMKLSSPNWNQVKLSDYLGSFFFQGSASSESIILAVARMPNKERKLTRRFQ